MSEYANVCQSMPMYARVCNSMPEYARVCQSVPEYARVCKTMLNYVPSVPHETMKYGNQKMLSHIGKLFANMPQPILPITLVLNKS